jgi:glycine cleavage system protein P-like pyridoxal-binding family
MSDRGVFAKVLFPLIVVGALMIKFAMSRDMSLLD